jgi:hypothetical protein
VSCDPTIMGVGPAYMRPDLSGSAPTSVATNLVCLECSDNVRLLQYWFYNIEYQSCGLLAVHEQVTRDYLARSSTHTVDDEALTAEIQSACRAFAQQQAELAKTVVIQTPQFVELPLRTKYPGEGEPLPHGDPPIPVAGRLPRPLGR